MNIIRAIFWNQAQARLRTGWRLVAFIALFVLIVVATQVAILLVVFGIAAASGTLQPGEGMFEAATRTGSDSLPLAIIAPLVITALIFVILWLAARYIDRRPFADFGFHMGRGWWLDLVFGLALGAALMGLIYQIELAAGWITVTGSFSLFRPTWGFWPSFIVAVVAFVLVGCQEEIFFRSYFMKNLAEAIPARWRGPKTSVIFAWLVSSVVFGAAHMGNPNVTAIAVFNIFLAGLLLGLPYLLTGDVAVSIGLHITWNLFQGNVFGFPVSGTDAGTSIIGITQSGPELWTGGEFGPEAGLIGIIAMLVGAGLIVLWARWRNGELKLFEALAEPPAARPASGYIADIEPSRN